MVQLEKERVVVIGSGNWGSVVGKLVSSNVAKYPDLFYPTVNMWVYEEMIENEKLSDIINQKHENVKYLPNIALPKNLIAVPQLEAAVQGASILIFVLPHQFVRSICKMIKSHLPESCKAISLIKGLDITDEGNLLTITDVIEQELGIETAALSGANLANEIAEEKFSETTIGCHNPDSGHLYQTLFQTSFFRVNIINDVKAPQLCGALKNIVGLAAGFVDGLKLGENSKAAVIRLGLNEMRKFSKSFFEGVEDTTFFESCGVADLITSCNGGRHRKLAAMHVESRFPLSELEAKELNGQKLQGTLTSKEVYQFLKKKGINMAQEYPLFYSVYRIVYKAYPPENLLSDVVVD